ncbi:MAG: hypothetical protein Q8Q85_08010 [Gemmatimonadales bacterium]|nr:hypothetical protein [Gemmatimonadales bacterium]
MRVLLVTAFVAAGAAPLAAQVESNRYLPMSSWATPYVDHLSRAGVLRGLDPLTRPLRRADVARAIAAVDTTAVGASALSMLRELAHELDDGADTVRWTLDASVGALGASDARRWALRPSADSTGIYPQAGLSASLELPHFALVTHPRIDNRLRFDPDYTGKKDRIVAGRNDEAYLTASWRYADLFFGIMDRNWGSPEVEGLLLSTSPYAFDHLMLRLGPRRLRLELLATQLDPLPLFNTIQPVNRYLSLHRLVVQPSSRFAFSLSEAALYAQTGGIPRSFEPWYVNPLNLFLLAQYNDVPTSNALLGADVSWQAGGSVRLFAQLYLDDAQVDEKAQGDKEPNGYGYTLSASGGAGGGAVSWSAFYTRVTNLAYRTPANEEQYTLRGVGIGRSYADYDQATARVTAIAAPRLLVGAELTWLRQGEGDFRVRYPAESLFATTPTLFEGVVERTARVAGQVAWTPRDGASLSAEIGRHFVRNAEHVDGASDGRWVWRVRVELRRRLSGALRW